MNTEDERLEARHREYLGLKGLQHAALVKYTYFILSAAAAGIALSVNQTANNALALVQIPLGLAVLLWGLSFFWGCRGVILRTKFLGAQADHLRLYSHGSAPNEKAEAEEKVTRLDRQSATAAGHQSIYLLAGAVAFIVWHLLEMYQRTVSLPNLPIN